MRKYAKTSHVEYMGGVPLFKGESYKHILISSEHLLEPYGEVMIRSPIREPKKDMGRGGIPATTDNLGNDFILMRTILPKGQRLGFYRKLQPVICPLMSP